MAVLSAVLATGSPSPTIAQETTERKRNSVVAFDMSRPHDDPTETTIDAAIRTLFCLEARDAINRGQLDRFQRQWVLAHGHHCRDARLLFDASGF